MGFFTSKTKQEYHNPVLEQYTQAYRGFAPWAFASLDPTAALESMGATTKLADAAGKMGAGVDLGPEAKKRLQEMSAFETEQLNAEKGALERIVERQKSGKFLTPQETDFINTSLDKAFEYTQKVGMTSLQRFADTLAGRRGLRTSDTPVAQPSMEAARDLQLGIGSERARLGLESTLNFATSQQAFDESFRQSLAGLRTGAWQTRMNAMFGGGMQGASGIRQNTTTSSTPSTAMQISQGMSLASQAISLGGQVASFGAGGSGMIPGGLGGGQGGGFGGVGGQQYSAPIGPIR